MKNTLIADTGYFSALASSLDGACGIRDFCGFDDPELRTGFMLATRCFAATTTAYGGKHCASIAEWNWIIRAGLKWKTHADHLAGSTR